MKISFDAISVVAAAEIIGCTPGRVRQMLWGGDLRGVKVGVEWIVSRTDAEKIRRNPASTGRPRKYS
jgi:hypothetical protein